MILSVLKVLFWIILYLTIGSLLDDACSSLAKREGRDYEGGPWIMLFLWPVVVILALMDTVGGKKK